MILQEVASWLAKLENIYEKKWFRKKRIFRQIFSKNI